ncbi:hypothetical protein PV10_05486 [Exophiala mesophila]|uniref:RING-type domain-containing protein n=1 Tax=Exophiala mesophila TaxID=212818 RepID=A0A0D1Z7Z0_EXOME|nr:uncharacterized protein PV10_05486 [Exophiala mesophila]KIV90882.1 hypothetical protein PV10_05486 [Exophiala mesophila]
MPHTNPQVDRSASLRGSHSLLSPFLLRAPYYLSFAFSDPSPRLLYPATSDLCYVYTTPGSARGLRGYFLGDNPKIDLNPPTRAPPSQPYPHSDVSPGDPSLLAIKDGGSVKSPRRSSASTSRYEEHGVIDKSDYTPVLQGLQFNSVSITTDRTTNTGPAELDGTPTLPSKHGNASRCYGQVESEADRIRRARKSQMEAMALARGQQRIAATPMPNTAEQIRLDERLATQFSLEEMASFPTVDISRQHDDIPFDRSSPETYQIPLPPLPSVYSNFQSQRNNTPDTVTLGGSSMYTPNVNDSPTVGRATLNVTTSTRQQQSPDPHFRTFLGKSPDEHISKPSNLPKNDRLENDKGVNSSSSPRNPENPLSYTAFCDQCELEREDVSFCPVCSFNYCAEHWDSQMLHRSRRPTTGIPHEKTNPHVATQILSIIEPCSDEVLQESLHRADEETTWFGVLPDQAGRLSLHDFGRYEDFLSESTFSPRSGQYPSLISFIGKTGAGKSTIVKGLVQLFSASIQSGMPQTPVVGMPQHQEIPTSGEVHLFWDPVSLHTNRPMLYADCEGLGAGSQEPMSARATANGSGVNVNRSNQYLDTSLHRVMQSGMPGSLNTPPGWASASGKNFRGVTRAITWAQTQGQHNREFIVENLYPRLLYTFSDIGEIQRLIKWAASAIEKSSNQPILPFAIIIINAVDSQTDRNLYDVGNATQKLLDGLSQAIHQNPEFRNWASFWRENFEQDIDTTKELLLRYYTDFRVVFVPEKGQPALVFQQYQALRNEIQSAVSRSQSRRLNARLLLNSEQLNPYLQFAFEHFSRTLETPFDFVRTSSAFEEFNSNSSPVLCLVKAYTAAFQAGSGCLDIFVSISPLVGSAIILDMARRELPGSPNANFPRYVQQLKQAMRSFRDEEWPCEARHPKSGERCIVVLARHNTVGHQLADGRIEQDIDPESVFIDAVYDILLKLYRVLMSSTRERGLSSPIAEKQIAFENHHRLTIQGETCEFFRDEKLLQSQIICLCCIFGLPSHPLLCGHVLCDQCFLAHGKFVGENVLQIVSCPICLKSWNHGRDVVKITRKPPSAGLRILSLDGGGIRALVDPVILGIIEDKIGMNIPIQEFFDLIVGTSGGGIVALAIGEKDMSVAAATDMFKVFAGRAFSRRRGSRLPLIGRIIQLKYQSQYHTQGLEKSLKESFGTEYLFGGPRTTQSSSRCKVAVTTTDTSGEARLLANYNRAGQPNTPYILQRFDKLAQEVKIWEAGRATSAAPGYFKGLYLSSNGHTYWDGAPKFNNPILAADLERQQIWPESRNQLPDIMLSLGTGFFPDSRTQRGEAGP